jgi:hypothetical protein
MSLSAATAITSSYWAAMSDRPGKRVSINGCARCEGEGHKDLLFHPFTHPIVMDDGYTFTWWAMCPTVNEPIMLAYVEIPDTVTE